MRTKLKPNIFFKNLLNKNVYPILKKKKKRHSILVNRMYENPELEYVYLFMSSSYFVFEQSIYFDSSSAETND